MSRKQELGADINQCSSLKKDSTSQNSSYGQILRSTAFTGGASAINIALGVIRTKVLAVLLGPSGVGLIGLYTSITGLASTLTGMGVGSSGVRQIAEAASSGDNLRIAYTVKTLRWISLVLGVVGGIALALLSEPVSVVTFGDSAHAWAVSVLGFSVVLSTVSAGQVALIQGLRRIEDRAWLTVFGAASGTLVSIPMIWMWKEQGIVPMLLVLSGTSLFFSWWFARRVSVSATRLGLREILKETRGLLGLGAAFMLSGVMLASVTYLSRLLIVRKLGLEEAGYFSAAYSLSGIYAGFILQAMGSDFYPRLTAVAEDNGTVNRLVNEQTEIALLFAVPGILLTLTLAPWVIRIFYAADFEPAVRILQWQVIGILGRVISWPMGFIQLAKGRRRIFLSTELAANGVHVLFIFVGIHFFGLQGTGMAFAGLYAFYCLLMLWVSRRLTGFVWSSANARLLGWMVPAVGVVFASTYFMTPVWGGTIGIIASLIGGTFCLKGLFGRVPIEKLGRVAALARWVS